VLLEGTALSCLSCCLYSFWHSLLSVWVTTGCPSGMLVSFTSAGFESLSMTQHNEDIFLFYMNHYRFLIS